MNRVNVQRIIVIVFMMGIVFPTTSVFATTQPAGDSFQPLSEIDVWINALSSYSFYTTGCEEGGRLYGSFEVTFGSDIDFCICDSETYQSWIDGNAVTVYELNENVGSLSYSFTIPEDGTWYIVFRNDAWLVRKHIEGTVNYASPAANPSSSSFAVLIIIGSAAILVIICVKVCSDQNKQKQKPTYGQPAYGQPYPPRKYPTQPQATSFCPGCGTPKSSQLDRFCPRCGRSFEPAPGIE